MKRSLILFALLLPVTAQEKPAEPAKPAAAKAEAAQEKKEEAVESPAPDVEKAWSGSVDVGYRWISTVGGDFNTYRSVINLGEGPRVMGVDLNYVKPSGKFADEFHLQGNNWGGDPYNTARLDAGKRGLYRFLGTYSNLAYFNYLPSFANPALARGMFMNQRSYDTALRNFDNTLDLFPGKPITPYVGFQRNSSFGNGITDLVLNQNEYPLRNLVRWSQDTYRGGVRMEFKKFHGTLEGGRTGFRDDQQVFSTERLNGNRTTPYLGQTLFLNQGSQVYGIRGDGPFVKALVTASPATWIDLYGQFLFSQPDTTVNFQQAQQGNLVDQAAGILFYTQGRDLAYGDARMPHSSGLAGTEIRPMSRLRIRYTFDTDRFHSSTSSLLTSNLVSSTTNQTRQLAYNDRLVVNQDRHNVEALFDLSSKVMFRGGYRRETGDATVRTGQLNFNGPFESGVMERNVGLFGLQVRPITNLTWNVDVERGDGKQTYFRTGLMTYYKFRTQVRYQVLEGLNINALYSVLNNENPSPGAGYQYKASQGSLSLQWMPKKLKGVSVLADYTRSSIYSDINYFVPAYGGFEQSLYRDNAHSGTLLVEWIGSKGKYAPRVSAGGSFVRTAGSRVTRYYQPLGRIIVPVHNRFQLYSEWRWYGLTQPFYLYEGFRNHQIVFGVRFMI